MPSPVPEPISRTIETLYRSESGRVLATLVRLLGDLDLAEESMHEAFAAALESWPQSWHSGQSASVADFNGTLQGHRRYAPARALRWSTERSCCPHGIAQSTTLPSVYSEIDDEEIEDDRLRLIFTCCHPALPAGRTGCAHAARSLRPDHGGDRPGISGYAGGTGAAYRARKDKDSRDTDSLRGAGARGIAGATGRGASGHLSRL